MRGLRSASVRDMARLLLARERHGDDAAAVATALQRACTRVSDDLRQSLGDDGVNALLVRVVTASQNEHPVLTDLCRVGVAGIRLDNVVVSVQRHGAATVTAALEAAFAMLIDVLGGLVGADMVPSLLDLDASFSPTSGNRQPI